MSRPYSNSHVSASHAATPAESGDSWERVNPDDPRNWYELGEWFDPGEGGPDSTHGADTVRLAFVYDSEWISGDDASRGVVTYCANGSDLAFHRPPNVTDPRWRCAEWHRRVSEFLESVAAHLSDQGMVFVGEPSVSALPLHSSGIVSYIATWALGGGDSVSALNHANVTPCGACHGCRNTADAVTSAPVESWVYFVQATTGGPVKIGRSATPRARVASLQTANAAELRIVATVPGGATVERAMHATFAADRIRAGGEWFNPSPSLAALVKELGGVLK